MMIRILKFALATLFLSSHLLANTNFFDEGLALYKNNDLEKAKFKFEQDLVFNPKSEKSYLYLSKIFNTQKKKELEEKNLKTVILLNPNNEEALFNLAKLRLEESDYKESKELIERLTNLCKNYCQKSKELKKYRRYNCW